MNLSDQQFLDVVKHTPLVSMDLIIRNPQNEVLLGLRTNEPAKDLWFVPGGRVQKDERLDDAFERILRVETGVDLKRSAAILKGVYEHHYQSNRFQAAGVSTHYVVLAYELKTHDRDIRPADDQHVEYRWFKTEDLLRDPDVHENTKAYF